MGQPWPWGSECSALPSAAAQKPISSPACAAEWALFLQELPIFRPDSAAASELSFTMEFLLVSLLSSIYLHGAVLPYYNAGTQN